MGELKVSIYLSTNSFFSICFVLILLLWSNIYVMEAQSVCVTVSSLFFDIQSIAWLQWLAQDSNSQPSASGRPALCWLSSVWGLNGVRQCNSEIYFGAKLQNWYLFHEIFNRHILKRYFMGWSECILVCTHTGCNSIMTHTVHTACTGPWLSVKMYGLYCCREPIYVSETQKKP